MRNYYNCHITTLVFIMYVIFRDVGIFLASKSQPKTNVDLYGVCVSQLVRFAGASSHVSGFNTHNKSLARRLFRQGCRHHKLCKTFSGFYRRHCDLISRFQVGLGSLLRQGLSELGFYGGLVCELGGLLALVFLARFVGVVSHCKKIGCGIGVLRQTACLVVDPIAVGKNTYLLMRWWGPNALAFDFFCSDIQFLVLLSPYLYFISFL